MEVLLDAWNQVLREGLLMVWLAAAFRVLIILAVAQIAIRILFAFIDKTLSIRDREGVRVTDDKRLRTLAGLIKSLLRYAVYFVAILSVLEVLGIDTRSVLAGAGIVGLAVGFGAQNLVKDVISGFFLVLENQFTVGEYVEAGGITGVVEEMGLRVTKFRDFSGALHAVPNGAITSSTNWSRGNMRVLVRVDVAYEEDLDRVFGVLEPVLKQMESEVDTIREGPMVLGVSDLGESSVQILLFAKTEPMAQWAVEREMRLRVKKAFDKEGIEIPYPRRVLVPARLTKVDDVEE